MEASMHKLPYVAVGLVLAMLAVAFLTKSLTPATGVAGAKQPSTILIDDLQRGLDLQALPIQDVKDPI